jgi:hypothetical protein
MLNRVMPCTRQLLVTTAAGQVLEIIDQVGDAHLGQALPEVERELERVTRHPVALTIVDREANSLELAQIYAKSDHFALLTLLDEPLTRGLVLGTLAADATFHVTGRWLPLPDEPGASLAPAEWGPARANPADPRVFWLVRKDATREICAVYSLSRPVADCTPEVAALLLGRGARTVYRRRWAAMENPIRTMVAGANLNENYGYTREEVPNRLRERQSAEAQAQVDVTQKQWEHVREQITQQQTRVADQIAQVTDQQSAVAQALRERQAEQHVREQAGQTTRRVEQQVASLERQAEQLAQRHARLQSRETIGPLAKLIERQTELETKQAERQATLAAIDVNQPMFERQLEKDQIMTDFQAVLYNAHQWCCTHYFSGEWSHAELDTALARIYRQRGAVVYTDTQVTVTLAAFATQAEQALAEAACQKFNRAQVHDAGGRLIVMGVAPFTHYVRHL